MPSIPPIVDGVLLPFAGNMSTKVTSTPTVYGLTAGNATSLAGLLTAFTSALAVADTPATRTKTSVELKNAAKRVLLSTLRQFIKIIKAQPTVTDAQRIDLGLSPRDAGPSPGPVPLTRPFLAVDPFGNVTVRDELTSERRGKPRGMVGAIVFAVILPDTAPAPTTPAEARFAGMATRDQFAVPVVEADGGRVLYVMAQWISGKGELGPVSEVVSTRIAT
jgi:hypothetical protein